MKCNFRFLTAVGLTISLWIIAAIAFGDWPQWRGLNRDGRSSDTGLLKQWPEDGPKLMWLATGLGLGYTNVSVVGGNVFAMGDLGDANYLIAINQADGKILWKTKVGKSGAPGWGGFIGPRCTPTVDNDLVFAVGQFGEVLCANAATGDEIWRKDYGKDFGAQRPEWGFAGMPLVDGDKVILVPGGKQGDLVALNKKTGKLIWRSKELNDSIHYSSPILVEIGGVPQIIQLTDASVAGIQASDGHLLWRAARKGSVAVIPTPIYHDGQVYVSSGYGAGCNLFKITADDGKFSAKQVYANKDMANHHGGVVRVGKDLYGFSDGKGWVCQDFETGEIVWHKQGIGKGSLAYADGLLYLRAEAGKGTVAIIEPSADGYKELGHFDPPDRSDKNSWPHPVITGGRLYLRDQDVLQCYDVQGK
ncbi:MAG: PQQ-binding-like beta-propeller repeat protein [Thermoguttaceae bacterium]|jgi:outer membrane protein assembly factor BamB